jgi:hypothetical protein
MSPSLSLIPSRRCSSVLPRRQTLRWTRHHPHSLKFHRVAAIEFLVLRRQLRELVDHDDETGRAGKIGVDCVVDVELCGVVPWCRETRNRCR